MGDLPALARLAGACLKADGGLPFFATESFLQPLFWGAGANAGGFDPPGRLVAAVAAQPAHSERECALALTGMVHPDWRGRGVGNLLMRWCDDCSETLLSGCPAGTPRSLRLSSESLSPQAERLFASYGYVQQFAEDVMRRSLERPLPEAPLPPALYSSGGMRLVSWEPGRASQFYEAYQGSFRDRPGFPGWSATQWIEWVIDDDEFAPEMSLLALDGDHPAGFIVCSRGWVAQMGVRPEWRGRGLAAALLVEALRRFQSLPPADGSQDVWLDVNTNNTPARQLYLKLGFQFAGRRARYLRNLD